MTHITLGLVYRDQITDFKGTAIADGNYLDGSKQVLLRPLGSEAISKHFEQWFDAQRLTLAV